MEGPKPCPAEMSKFGSLPLASILTVLVGCAPAPPVEQFATVDESLSVLLITVDDMNWDSAGVYGAAIPDLTPNIDALAAQGMRFEQAHVTIAICQPTRAVWMTGRYPHRSGALGFEEIRPDVPTLVEALGDVGYYTGVMAKTGHVLPSRPEIWDEVIPARELANGRSPDLYYERTLDFLLNADSAGEPFFLMANSQDPHRPFAASATEAAARATDAESTNHQYGGGFPDTPLAFDPAEIPVPGFLPDLPGVRQELAEYYTSVRRADETTGAILRALDDSGLTDRTVVMFLSDHGIAVPFAKTNVWMHSTRTPWIIRWPGVVTPGTVDERHLVSGVDLAPTILDLLALPPLPGADGHAFTPVLRGEAQDNREVVFTHMNSTVAPEWYGMRAVNDARFGYIYNAWADGETEFFNNSMRGLTFPAMQAAAADDAAIAARIEHLLHRAKEELYDYATDPDALDNLIGDPAQAERIERSRELLLEHMRATDDPELDEYGRFLATVR